VENGLELSSPLILKLHISCHNLEFSNFKFDLTYSTDILNIK